MMVTEFIFARLAEDEALAISYREQQPHQRHITDFVGTFNGNCPTCRMSMPDEQAKRDIAFKRHLVENHQIAQGQRLDGDPATDARVIAERVLMYRMLWALAGLWEDHPDYPGLPPSALR